MDLSSLWKPQVLKPHRIFPGTAESHQILVRVTFGNKDMGRPLNLLREASCGLTCTHTTTYAHTHSLQTQSGTGTSTQPHSFQPSAGLLLLLIARAWAGAAWTQSRSFSCRALRSGTESRAGPGRWVERLYHTDTVRSSVGKGGRA